MTNETSKYITFKKVNVDEQIVYGEVYAPNVIDTQGEFMEAGDIKSMAHKFVTMGGNNIDVMHDNEPIQAHFIESFIARKNDPDYTEDAWILGIKIDDLNVWEDVVSGKLNGFSYQALVNKTSVIAEISFKKEEILTTEDGLNDDHVHYAYVNYDSSGKIISGKTSITNGHSHTISHASNTDDSDGHSHRFIT